MEPKWIEQRKLTTSTSRAVQGNLEMFVEILTVTEARKTPPKRIAPPTPKEYELR